MKTGVANQHTSKDISGLTQQGQQNIEVSKFTNLMENYNCKYIPTANYKHKINDCLDSYKMKNERENLRSKIDNGDKSNEGMIKVLRNICINISDKAFTKLIFAKTNKMSKKKTNFQEWFDDDFRKAKQMLTENGNCIKKLLRIKFPIVSLNYLRVIISKS